MASLPDVSPWLVTASNPPTSGTNGLDFVRCAALHNYMAQMAWTGLGNSWDDFEKRSWFDRHGDEAEAVRDRLHPTLASFLEQAYDWGHTVMSLNYLVWTLSTPDELWKTHEPDVIEFDDEEGRFLTLYNSNINLGNPPDGVNYEQESHTAITQMSLWDRDYARSETGRSENPPWYPLESVLTAWIEMIHKGKMATAPEGEHLDNDKYDPWIWRPWSEQLLEDSITAFERLATAVESRMPIQEPVLQGVLASPAAEKLISGDTAIAAGLKPSSFAYSFVTRLRRPHFTRIAPGLRLPNEQDFTMQPLTNVPAEDEDDIVVPPVLLFPTVISAKYDIQAEDGEGSNPFCDSYWTFVSEEEHSEIPAGLYLASADLRMPTPGEDGFYLFLPFSLSLEDGFAKRSDGLLLESTAQIFQHGHQPFGGERDRPQRIVRLLEKWAYLVETGTWEVDANGVAGDIEKFRDADDEDTWQDYWIESSW